MSVFTRSSASTAIGERITQAQRSVEAAEREIPGLREEDRRAEAEIAALLGRQIAEGCDLGAQITKLRARRTSIASEIEQLRAASDVATAGLAEAQKIKLHAQRREVRTQANAARLDLARLLGRAESLLQELFEIDAQLPALVADEWRLWKAENVLHERLGVSSSTPHSDAPTNGSVLLNPALEAITSMGARRVDSFRSALSRLQQIRERATAIASEPIPD